MRNIYYTYHVASKQRPADTKDFKTIKEVMDYTKLSVLSVYESINKGHRIKDWIISRTPIQKSKEEAGGDRLKTYGVIVYFPNGRTRSFRSQRECAYELGISSSTVYKCLKSGRSDIKGNEYDYLA